MSTEERNLPPTYRRLRDARHRGQIPRSKDLHDAFQFAGAIAALTWGGGFLLRRLGDTVSTGMVAVGERAHHQLVPADMTNLAFRYGAMLALIVGPIALGAAAGGLAAVTLQGGWSVSWVPLHPNLGRLSPANGLKRLLPSNAGLELLRSLVVGACIVWIVYGSVQELLVLTPAFGRLAPSASAEQAWTGMLTMMRRALVVFAVLGAGDYLLKRWQHRRSLRMTRQELKDENKMLEGNPQIKSRVRRVQMEMVRRRMLAAVPKSTVVITNPTHFAVALEYRREAMTSPKVLAKGADHLAQRIKEVAREHGIPMVENVALARALFAHAEVDQHIPADLFEAVAEVLAYLVRLKQLTL